MPKLRVLSGRQLMEILAQHGFRELRQKGSHVIMQLSSDDTSITIPVPDHREIRIGTLMSIIRQSGLDKNLFAA
jgi:predicted RNA binding protein YcfA (HicA-like mRNA interferase family)